MKIDAWCDRDTSRRKMLAEVAHPNRRPAPWKCWNRYVLSPMEHRVPFLAFALWAPLLAAEVLCTLVLVHLGYADTSIPAWTRPIAYLSQNVILGAPSDVAWHHLLNIALIAAALWVLSIVAEHVDALYVSQLLGPNNMRTLKYWSDLPEEIRGKVDKAWQVEVVARTTMLLAVYWLIAPTFRPDYPNRTGIHDSLWGRLFASFASFGLIVGDGSLPLLPHPSVLPSRSRWVIYVCSCAATSAAIWLLHALLGRFFVSFGLIVNAVWVVPAVLHRTSAWGTRACGRCRRWGVLLFAGAVTSAAVLSLHEHLPLLRLSVRCFVFAAWVGVVLLLLCAVAGGFFLIAIIDDSIPQWGRQVHNRVWQGAQPHMTLKCLATLALALVVKFWIFDRLATSDAGAAELSAAWEAVLPIRWAHQRWRLGHRVGGAWTAFLYATRANRMLQCVTEAWMLRTTALQICNLAARLMLYTMVTLARIGSASPATLCVSICTAMVDDFVTFFVLNAALHFISTKYPQYLISGNIRGVLAAFPRRQWMWPVGASARADVQSWTHFQVQICEAIPTAAYLYGMMATLVTLPFSLLAGFLHGQSFTIGDAYRCISLRPLGLWMTNLDDNSWRWPIIATPLGIWKQFFNAPERWSIARAWERGFALKHQQYPYDPRCARAWDAHAIWGANAILWNSTALEEEAQPSMGMPGDIQRLIVAVLACAALQIMLLSVHEAESFEGIDLSVVARLQSINEVRVRSGEVEQPRSRWSSFSTLRNWTLPAICTIASPLTFPDRYHAPATSFRYIAPGIFIIGVAPTIAYIMWRAFSVVLNDAGPYMWPIASSSERGFGITCAGSIEDCIAY